MSSPPHSSGLAPVVHRVASARKRILSDSEDTEERDTKRVKAQVVAEDQGKRKDSKEKKKRRKKKRKVSVVQAVGSSDGESPLVPTQISHTRSRSRTLDSVDTSTPKPTISTKQAPLDTRQPFAGPSALPAPSKKEDSVQDDAKPIHPDKGKARATSREFITEQDSSPMLEERLSAKSALVTQHENLLSTLQQSLSCQICLDLMHRPFALSCGHSACYQCLQNWFRAPPADVPADEAPPAWLRKKTCPHCRTIVKERPVEIWSIKEMVANLAKSGLVQGFYNPAPEPTEGAPAASADPWAGIFRPDRNSALPDPAPMQQLMGWRDEEDGGVYRCIDCHHEIWDGMCSSCGRVYHGHDDGFSDEYDDDSVVGLWREEIEEQLGPRAHGFALFPNPFGFLFQNHIHWDDGGDTEVDTDDESGSDGPPRAPRAPRPRNLPLPGPYAPIDGSDVEVDGEDHDEEDGGYESSFIDDGDDAQAGPRGERSHGSDEHPIELTDDEDELEDDYHPIDFIRYTRRGRLGASRGANIIESDAEDDEEEEAGYSHHEGDDDDAAGEDDDLADEVAARELELYGDDGSIPRGGRRFVSYDSEEEVYY